MFVQDDLTNGWTWGWGPTWEEVGREVLKHLQCIPSVGAELGSLNLYEIIDLINIFSGQASVNHFSKF